MNYSSLIARQLREVYFGGNWTGSNFNDTLGDVSLEEAVQNVKGLNSIATLVAHINYYVPIIREVLNGGQLKGKDAESFSHPAFKSESEWREYVKNKSYEAEGLAKEIENIPDKKLKSIFEQEKYGSYFRNFAGFIEHSHYHLGQIALIKKIIRSR